MPVRGPGSPVIPPRAPAAAPRVTDRPTIPVTGNDAQLNVDGSGAPVNAAARPKATLDLNEILAAPEPRRGVLLWRLIGNASLRAGLALGSTRAELPAGAEVERPGLRFSTDGREVTITLDGEARAIDTRAPRPEDALFALRAFSRALVRDGETDPAVARFFLPLFGSDGAFVTGGAAVLDEEQRFQTPKLVCWDFNGTVERFGDGRPRPDMAGGTSALRRRGAMSVLTTTIGPEKPERFLDEQGVSFVTHYGRAEVRPTKGNKEYRGIAAEHGVTPAQAPGVMAVFGDSRTDIPSDLPGVVFFHNDANTPAPAAERLLMELDRAGDGHLADGLASILGGLPAIDGSKRAQVGPIAFTVEMRDSGSAQRPCLIPTIHEVSVSLDAGETAGLLRAPPPPNDLDARAAYKLALEHLADALPPTDVPAALRGAQGSRGEAPARAAVERRAAWRAHEVEQAKTFLRERAAGFVSAPIGADSVIGQLRALASLGEPSVARELPALAQSAVDVAPAAERETLAALETFAGELRAKVASARATALRFFPRSDPGDARALSVLTRAAKNPVPVDARGRERIVEAVDAVAASPVGAEALLANIADGLDDALAKARDKVKERFAERKDRSGEILGAVANAGAFAADTAAAWRDIDAALR